MDKEDFKEAEKDEKVILLGRNDLYLCGKWLEMRKFGTFRCQKCRKLLPRSANKRGQPRKYCEECAKLLKNEVSKKYFCVDCGKGIEHNSVTQRICKRCATCQYEYEKKLKRDYWARNFGKSKKLEE